MSKASWLEEFGLEDPLKKWTGLLPGNLTKHGGLKSVCWVVFEDGRIDTTDCTWCYEFQDSKCVDCPLFKIREGTRCDAKLLTECTSPWHSWTVMDDPGHMLEWVRRAYGIKLDNH